MARYKATVESRQSVEDVFAYLSDFSTTAEWDPGISSARRLDSGPIGMGSRFEVVASTMGREVPFIYEVRQFDPPRWILLTARKRMLTSYDQMTFEPRTDGMAVTYDANLVLSGPLKLADPALALGFTRTGDRAVAGLRETLAARAQSMPTAAGGSHGGSPD